ncbi:GNAT family N-acetyltransferase [Robertmurraya kyonggiensis]|uniref:GNAT family N-acetyltransferase n=1 Tax=Robertmurraya kyonggiensis TaxID=1037680 RepID=A0A4U1D3F3_9BACI|nr:GNAT family N-acetyltransferase [Robertmurraya kyonggiensis]TKC15747.1 GNAT family N-acetyltransferase [Robertmurraya kyonggiensis]
MEKTQELFIRQLEITDAEDLLKLEIENRDFFQLYAPLKDEKFYTLDGQVERIKNWVLLAEQDSVYAFGIFLTDSKQLIGNVTLSEVARGNYQSCWIGYSLDRKQNGKGYMTKAVKLVVDYGFNELKLHRIEAGVMPHNIGSMKVLEKAGFHKEGIAIENVKINGKWENHQTLAIVNNEKDKPKVIRKNPLGIASPIGDYSHLTIVPKGAELITLSGQVGVDREGNIPVSVEEQFQIALENTITLLNSENINADGIIKVNIWLTETVDREVFVDIYKKFHNGSSPSMTLAYISALGTPDLKVEIEVWAARL